MFQGTEIFVGPSCVIFNSVTGLIFTT